MGTFQFRQAFEALCESSPFGGMWLRFCWTFTLISLFSDATSSWHRDAILNAPAFRWVLSAGLVLGHPFLEFVLSIIMPYVRQRRDPPPP
jgi:hypothetical protein